MKKIYVDFDDVLCETAQTLLKIAADRFGKTVEYENINAFDPGRVLKLDEAQVDSLLDMAHQPEYLMANHLIQHAPMALAELNRMGYEIHIVTGRPPQTRHTSEKWLVKYQIPFHELHFVNKYLRDSEAYSTSETLTLEDIAQMEFVFAVEDSAEMADYISENMGIPVFLMNRPWNRCFPFRQNIYRCSGWLEILRKLNGAREKTSKDGSYSRTISFTQKRSGG